MMMRLSFLADGGGPLNYPGATGGRPLPISPAPVQSINAIPVQGTIAYPTPTPTNPTPAQTPVVSGSAGPNQVSSGGMGGASGIFSGFMGSQNPVPSTSYVDQTQVAPYGTAQSFQIPWLLIAAGIVVILLLRR